MSTLWIALWVGTASAGAVDWPVYRHDLARSGATAAVAKVRELKPAWTHRAPVAPQPAWDATARQDAYHGIRWLPERRLYDAAFEPIVVGRTIYFGSSADDTLYALDLETGLPRWRRTVGGPIRVAPSHHGGKIYFGSDDGFAYCVDAESGEEVWRYSAAKPTRLVLQDGRFVSPMACRTGVVVREDVPGVATAYFGQSLLPWNESYLCGVDAQTGQPTGPGRYVRRSTREGHFDGPLSVTDRLLYCPRGNTAGQMFTLREAAPLGHTWAATGGCFALFFPIEDRILSGGFAYQGKAALLDAPLSGASGPESVRYVLGVASAAYREGILYLQSPDKVQAVRRATGESLWTAPLGETHCVVAASDAVFVGGDDRVIALDPESGKVIWESPTNGRVYSLVVVDDALIASTDSGELTCYRPSGKPVPLVEAADTTPPVAAVPDGPKPEPAELRTGPALRFLYPNTAEVTWETEHPSPSILEFGPAPKRRVIRDETLRTEHCVVVNGLVPRRVYPYRIRTVSDGIERESSEFTCDSYLNYNIPTFPQGQPHEWAADPDIDRTLQQILKSTKLDRGLCLVLGAADRGALGWRLAQATGARVLIVDTSTKRIEAARQAILPTGAYGTRVAAIAVESLSQLPLPSHSFRLVVATDARAGGTGTGSAVEIERLLDPIRGVAVIGRAIGEKTALGSAALQDWLAPVQRASAEMPRLTIEVTQDNASQWATLRLTGGLPGAQPWTHQYADSANTACSDDTLQGATTFSQMTTQWLGRPGGRYQADRMVRKPAPLAANGRLLLQGHGNIICVDSASGTVLWTLEIPSLGRYNLVRDASNYCTDGKHVFLAFKDRCWVIDLESGRVVRTLDVALPPDRKLQDWSYIATTENLLLGTSTTPGTAFTNSWGGGAWYEHNDWEKICSSALFANDKQSFERRWTYRGGAIVNTTIAAGDGRAYFLETRQPEVVAADKRKLNGAELWKQPWLVAIDLATGDKVWERSFGEGEFPWAQVMCGMVFSRGKLIFHGSTPATVGGGPKGYFHLRGFEAASGADAWKTDDPWAGYGHGIQTSYPVVVGDRLFYSPRVIQVDSGERLPIAWNEGHCGTTSASCHALFYRFTTIAFWDIARGAETRWPTVRPDCWLSAIPADGLLQAPEGGGGCVCGGWLETSAALAPRTDFALFRTTRRQFLGELEVELDPPVGGGVVRFTTDGSEPDERSARYERPIRITESTTIRTRVLGGPDARHGGPEISQTFERLAPSKYPTAARIEFQPITVGGGAPDDLIDYGEPLQLQAGGYAYGWRADGFESLLVVDASKRTDSVKESLVWLSSRNQWEIAVENGEYDVTLLIGHPDGETKRKDVGAILVGDQRLEPDRDLAKGEMAELKGRVRVTDGVLGLRKPHDDRTSVGVSWLRFSRVEATSAPAE